ncbi:MAG: hypothetical protein ACI845_002180, partial [Gammaproteobacteria bacterium]
DNGEIATFVIKSTHYYLVQNVFVAGKLMGGFHVVGKPRQSGIKAKIMSSLNGK